MSEREERRQRQVELLDRLEAVVEPLVTAGNRAAARRLRAIREQRAALLGFDPNALAELLAALHLRLRSRQHDAHRPRWGFGGMLP